jgi:hypothetical protein
MIGDSVRPGKGKFKVVSRTIYNNGITAYYLYEPDEG